MLTCRRLFRGKLRAVILLQTEVRLSRWRVRSRRAAIVIQREWRRWDVRVAFDFVRSAAVAIQAWARGRMCRLALVAALQNVVVIQSFLRLWLARKCIGEIKAVMKIQRRFRLWKFQRCRSYAANVIQTQYRLLLGCRRCVAATVLQSVVRQWLARSRFMMLLSSCLHVQRNWRLAVARKREKAVRTIQKSASWWVRRRKETTAAVLMQRCFRGQRSREGYLLRRRSSIMIQSNGRKWLSRRAYLRTRMRIVVLQSLARQRCVRSAMDRWHEAARSIQCRWRSKNQRDRFLSIRGLSIQLQSRWRGYEARRVAQTELQALLSVDGAGAQELKNRSALQNGKVNMTEQATVAIQAAFRGRVSRIEYGRVRKAVVLLQARVRGWSCRCRLESGERTGVSLGNQVDEDIVASNRGVSEGSSLDALQISKSNTEKKQKELAAVHIQSIARGLLTRRLLELQKSAAQRIQLAYFTWKMELTLLNVESSVVLLKRGVRGQLVRSATRFALNHLNTSMRSSVLDAFARLSSEESSSSGDLAEAWVNAESKVHASAAVVIQNAARRMLASTRTMQAKEISLPNGSLGPLTPNAASSRLWSSSTAATTAQQESAGQPSKMSLISQSRATKLRIIRAEHTVQKRQKAAGIVQRAFRRYSMQTKFKRTLRAVIMLQRVCRRHTIRRLECCRHQAATQIQRGWRAHVERQREEKSLLSALIQRQWRAYRQRHHFKLQRSAAVRIQRPLAVWQKQAAGAPESGGGTTHGGIQTNFICDDTFNASEAILRNAYAGAERELDGLFQGMLTTEPSTCVRRLFQRLALLDRRIVTTNGEATNRRKPFTYLASIDELEGNEAQESKS